MATATSTKWIAGNGSWNTDANWDKGVPVATTAATIPSRVTVTFSGTSTIRSLTMTSNPSNPGVLQMNSGTLSFQDVSSLATVNQTAGTMKFAGKDVSSIVVLNGVGASRLP